MQKDEQKIREPLEEARIAVRIVGNTSAGELDADIVKRYALERAMERLCETAGKLSERVRKRHGHIEWNKIAAIRVLLTHVYHKIDSDELLDAARTHVPELSATLERDELMTQASGAKPKITTVRGMQVSDATRVPNQGPTSADVEEIFRAHKDKIPATLTLPNGKVLFGLSTEDGVLTTLYTIIEGGEREFIKWMEEHEQLWGTPFHSPNDGDDGLGRYISEHLKRARDIGTPGAH